MKCVKLLALLLPLCCRGGNGAPETSVVYLRTEYRVNPRGIDVLQPRFSWELRSDRKGERQTGYQVMVGTDSLALLRNTADMWDSRKVTSGQTSQVRYAGKKLVSGRTYFWKVRIWDASKKEGEWSSIASWSAGLLHPGDWKAEWIGDAAEEIPNEAKYYIHHGYQSDFVSRDASAGEWVAVDLGEIQEISEIRLHPVHYKNNPDGYLFPKRFKIELSDTPDFRSRRLLADESGSDVERKGAAPYVTRPGTARGRYVRVVVTKLAETENRKYAYALAELEVLNPVQKNVALKKKVTASASYSVYPHFSNENWLPEKLTDGFYKSNPDHKAYSLPVPPSPLLRKTFSLSKKIRKGTLYAAALGIYELYVNGQKAGNQVLAPEWTDYHTRVQYQTYDVTAALRQGGNVIGAMLADGWYAGAVFSHPDRGSYGFDRRLIAQLEVVYEDGSTEQVLTDGSWRLLANGPVQKASLFDGETFDARLLPDKWLQPGFDDSQWKNVTVDRSVDVTLSAQLNEPVSVLQEIKPVGLRKVKEGTYIFDLGQNIAGWVNLKLDYTPEGPVTFRHGEVLDENGALYTDNLRGAKQTDVYIPGAEGSVDYEPRFTYHGFRYVEISGLSREPHPGDVTGKVVASAAAPTGTFESSSADLNKLWSNILWTQRGNMHSVPTDCPQRDERAGWMGDAQVFAQTAVFNLDMAAFFSKWVRDIRDSQRPDGRYPDYAPQVGTWNNFYNSPGWGDAGVLVPWRMYQNYGDTVVLANHYASMKAYIGYILKTNPDLLWKNARGNMYGDWLNGNTILAADYPKEGGKVPDDVYSTAFFEHSTRIVARVAKLLHHKKDYVFYDSLANAVRTAFIKNYVSPEGIVSGNTQAGYALALDFNLIPEPLRKKAAAHMVEAIKAYDYRISTGIQTTIRLMNQLTEFGYGDVAYRLLESRRFPSWIYSIDQGATTIWERWDGYVKNRGFQDVGMNSFNHYAIGAVGEWLYRSILGINVDAPGYRHFTVRPVPGGTLQWARGSYHSIAGKIAVDWKTGGQRFELNVVIPPNTSATVILPAGKSITEKDRNIDSLSEIRTLGSDEKGTSLLVPSGSYSFRVAL